jgi:hypothetical protein
LQDLIVTQYWYVVREKEYCKPKLHHPCTNH